MRRRNSEPGVQEAEPSTNIPKRTSDSQAEVFKLHPAVQQSFLSSAAKNYLNRSFSFIRPFYSLIYLLYWFSQNLVFYLGCLFILLSIINPYSTWTVPDGKINSIYMDPYEFSFAVFLLFYLLSTLFFIRTNKICSVEEKPQSLSQLHLQIYLSYGFIENRSF